MTVDGASRDRGDRRAFREAVEHAGHAIYWTDTAGTIEHVNPAFEEQTGYTAEEAVGSNANILQSGVHGERFYERLWDTILSGDVWEGEITNERKTGERYVVKQTISPVTDESGDIVRFVAVNEDVTDLRESRARLERERDRFAHLLDAVPVPLVLVDFAGDAPRVARANERFRDTFGYTDRELAGASLDDLIVHDAAADDAREINERVRSGERVGREVTRRDADGVPRTFLLYATSLGPDDRSEVLATYVDITDRKRAEAALERRTAELEDFADVVSHDLRNPLNVASGHLDALDAAGAADDEHVAKIRAAHERMGDLIENVLALAKRGRTIDDTHPVALADCVGRCWRTIDSADATLAVESTRTVVADESRLRQLLSTLFRNAVEHGGDDVTVTVGDLDDGSGFYVEDDGPGIPPSERDDVLEMGYTTGTGGTGLGLGIVSDIAHAHGGDVTVTTGESGGARFEFTGVEFAD
ncbi:MAG: PAS domain-containing sensor histidine kinase [Halarchaeum sp.]